MGGVHCYIVAPTNIKPHRLLLHMHLGGFIWGSGESGTSWAIAFAGLTGYKVVVVDYGLLPNHVFPEAMDDATAVWKHLVRSQKPAEMAFVGVSIGGEMALSLVQRAKLEGLPLPGAVVSISPAGADFSKTGDTWYTNAGVDGSAVYDGFWEAVFKFYANGHELKDPALSPVYGDFKGFPPTYLVTGTRDIVLSDTVRVQRKLLQAGIPTQLVVVEGAPHGSLSNVDIPEVAEAYREGGKFLDVHLSH
jgi:acetyl esterase/lipase